ncbi:MAG: Gfo/Idh/MocA family protein [Armatimonadota bacterium]
MQQLGYGVIGLGRISARHLDAIDRLEGGRVVAVADADADKAREVAAARDLKAYTDYHQLLEREDVDVAVVLVPTHLHREVAVAAADAGKHVICEKAMAPSVADCRAMLEARDRNGVKLMVAHSTRFVAQFIVARRLVEERAIGEVVGLDAHFTAGATQPHEVPHDFWRFKAGAAGHGYVVNFGSHYIDTARAMTGADPISVSGYVGNRFSRGVIPEDRYVITALCEPDITISIAQYGVLESYPVPPAGYAIFGTRGMIQATLGRNAVLLSQANEKPREVAVEPGLLTEDAWEREHRGFCRSVVQDTVEPVTGEDAMKNVEWAIAGYLSSQRRCWVDLPLTEEDCAYSGPQLDRTIPATE